MCRASLSEELPDCLLDALEFDLTECHLGSFTSFRRTRHLEACGVRLVRGAPEAFLPLSLGMAPELVPLGRRTKLQMIPPCSLAISQGWGLIDLPLRASNEGFLKPRIARAQMIIKLHPLLCSGSTKLALLSVLPLPPRPSPPPPSKYKRE
jgi:hypothetical protein